ncbi:glycosyltransferase family 2 protein [Vibrio intestinalis]|uniref:glycosyltransferase family 2 protein n=1 Tax=Vibrio intestinalis TaxID=2933291 RepID=UPI0021A67E79|nr:glycosyltransferase family 2 protein [Vibrio intestinalis]
MKYSVIVPIYNTFDYAKKIIEWFEAEQYRREADDIELLLIDDGSQTGPDYQIASPSIHMYRKENGGVSSARNHGIDKANGDYILFLDSDDAYEAGLFSHLDQCLAQNDIDSVLFSFKKISDHQIDEAHNRAETVSGQMALSKFLTKDIRVHICSMMLSKSVLEAHQLRFDESLHFSEDVLFIIDYLSVAKSSYITDLFLYNHIMRSGSAINSPLTGKDTTHIDAFDRISLQAKKVAADKEVNFFISTCYINLIKFLIKNKTQDEQVFSKIIAHRHFLFGSIEPKLNKYSLIVLILRMAFKVDGLINYRLLRKLSVVA